MCEFGRMGWADEQAGRRQSACAPWLRTAATRGPAFAHVAVQRLSPAILPLLQAATGSPRRLQAWFASWHSTPVRPLPALPAAARQPASHRLLHATINTAWHVPGLERWVHFTASHPD